LIQSTISWTRSPYDANIDIKAEFLRNLDLQDITPPPGDRGGRKDEITGILIMTNTLMSPKLTFNIEARKADQEGKDAIAALKVKDDMLTKQFFAILVLQRFIPIYGSGQSGSGAMALIEDQMNALFDAISGDLKISANLSGTKGFKVQKQVSDNISISVSGGVVEGNSESASSIVGDVRVEYKLNDDGTFTLNFFNESNTGADANQGGGFTQGVSMHYQETFDDAREFKLLQGFLNIFRSKENDVEYRDADKANKRKTPIPVES
jgi:hypothetical protein